MQIHKQINTLMNTNEYKAIQVYYSQNQIQYYYYPYLHIKYFYSEVFMWHSFMNSQISTLNLQ